jgi:hypothetical protein
MFLPSRVKSRFEASRRYDPNSYRASTSGSMQGLSFFVDQNRIALAGSQPGRVDTGPGGRQVKRS